MENILLGSFNYYTACNFFNCFFFLITRIKILSFVSKNSPPPKKNPNSIKKKLENFQLFSWIQYKLLLSNEMNKKKWGVQLSAVAFSTSINKYFNKLKQCWFGFRLSLRADYLKPSIHIYWDADVSLFSEYLHFFDYNASIYSLSLSCYVHLVFPRSYYLLFIPLTLSSSSISLLVLSTTNIYALASIKCSPFSLPDCPRH